MNVRLRTRKLGKGTRRAVIGVLASPHKAALQSFPGTQANVSFRAWPLRNLHSLDAAKVLWPLARPGVSQLKVQPDLCLALQYDYDWIKLESAGNNTKGGSLSFHQCPIELKMGSSRAAVARRQWNFWQCEILYHQKLEARERDVKALLKWIKN
ncbi:hypothetical protein F5887DRAFT_916018 [Amanita rubescens]|nr:hypothetical protein F5887DRAFT_916018 [Amanita rubescens]